MWFNVVGVRPIDVMVEVIWVNHYPVDLHLSWNSEASNSTSSHVSLPFKRQYNTQILLHLSMKVPIASSVVMMRHFSSIDE